MLQGRDRGHDTDAERLLGRLADVRRLTAEVAAVDGVDGQLAALAQAALEVTGFGCGQVYAHEDGEWVGHGGGRCSDPATCTVCHTDPRFTEFSADTVVFDRLSPPGATVLADTPRALAQVLVTPVPLGPDRRTVLVLRTDDPDAQVDRLSLELVRLLATRCAVAIAHANAADAAPGRSTGTTVVTAERRHLQLVG